MSAMPYGANEIAALRAIGKRPADMVLLSLIGPLRENNPVVVAKVGKPYDWRFLVGLDVLVVAKSDTDKPAVKRILDDLQKLPTEYLGLWLADKQDGMNIAWGTCKARPRGVLRHLMTIDRANFSGIGRCSE
jgi:hypothetical protein